MTVGMPVIVLVRHVHFSFLSFSTFFRWFNIQGGQDTVLLVMVWCIRYSSDLEGKTKGSNINTVMYN